MDVVKSSIAGRPQMNSYGYRPALGGGYVVNNRYENIPSSTPSVPYTAVANVGLTQPSLAYYSTPLQPHNQPVYPTPPVYEKKYVKGIFGVDTIKSRVEGVKPYSPYSDMYMWVGPDGLLYKDLPRDERDLEHGMRWAGAGWKVNPEYEDSREESTARVAVEKNPAIKNVKFGPYPYKYGLNADNYFQPYIHLDRARNVISYQGGPPGLRYLYKEYYTPGSSGWYLNPYYDPARVEWRKELLEKRYGNVIRK